MSVREFAYWYVRRPAGKVPYWVAARMPKWLVYHCAIRLMVHACSAKYPTQIVPELTAVEALDRWKKSA
jgi:hypothetical protein